MRNVLRTSILLLSFVILSHMPCFAQNLIKGEVIDADNGEPLIGANVIVKNEAGKGTVTDFDGTFELRVEKLPVTLNISYIGYTAVDYEVTNVGQKILIKMGEDAVTIDLGVEIKGQRVSEKQKAAPLTIESLDAIAIKQTASNDFYSGLG
ncbi:MAG: carboxypeptidase-like regulatory domain-containing protein, partial [Saprospiraceae bacterium]